MRQTRKKRKTADQPEEAGTRLQLVVSGSVRMATGAGVAALSATKVEMITDQSDKTSLVRRLLATWMPSQSSENEASQG